MHSVFCRDPEGKRVYYEMGSYITKSNDDDSKRAKCTELVELEDGDEVAMGGFGNMSSWITFSSGMFVHSDSRTHLYCM